MNGQRVDKWLWCVRLFKTRSAATDACRRGLVQVDGRPVKPSASILPGRTLTIRSDGRCISVRVLQTLENRVAAAQLGEFRRITSDSASEGAARTLAQRILDNPSEFRKTHPPSLKRIDLFLHQLQQA